MPEKFSKYIARPNTAPTSDAMPALESKLNRTMIRLKIRLGTLTIADALLRQKPGGEVMRWAFVFFIIWLTLLSAGDLTLRPLSRQNTRQCERVAVRDVFRQASALGEWRDSAPRGFAAGRFNQYTANS
jgi:hypothetical protein